MSNVHTCHLSLFRLHTRWNNIITPDTATHKCNRIRMLRLNHAVRHDGNSETKVTMIRIQKTLSTSPVKHLCLLYHACRRSPNGTRISKSNLNIIAIAEASHLGFFYMNYPPDGIIHLYCL